MKIDSYYYNSFYSVYNGMKIIKEKEKPKVNNFYSTYNKNGNKNLKTIGSNIDYKI